MRHLLSFFSLLVVAWVAAWISFLHDVPKHPTRDATPTDAIVVLTGGALRVEHGFKRLSENNAHILLISGVGGDTNLDKLFETHTTPEIRTDIDAKRPRIILDHMARSTRTNAEETALFARMHNVHSMRLITANYHMPRSLLEMQHAMPDMMIVPDPVFPKGFTAGSWWHHGASRNLLLSEFHKVWAVKLHHMLRGLDAELV